MENDTDTPDAGLELDESSQDDLGDEGDSLHEGEGDDAGAGDAGEGGGDDSGDAEGDDLVISFGDEEPPKPEEDEGRAPPWIRDLRKANREKDRVIRERDAEIARLKGAGNAQPEAPTLGDKPKMSDPEIDFDEEKFSEALDKWHERKRKVEEVREKAERAKEDEQKAWRARVDQYKKAASSLPVKDYEDAEETAFDALSVVQQGIILQGTENPEKLVYGLGKNPKKLKEIASITDPVKFAVAVGKLEDKMKTTKRNTPPPPERVVRSNVSGAAAVDNQKERLLADARRTGNYEKVAAYNREQQEKSRKQA